MNTVLSTPFPIGFIVIAMSIIVLIITSLMVFLSTKGISIATPTVIISIFMLLTFITVTIYSTLREIPETKTGELLLGALISTFTTVIVFWFGKGGGSPDNKE